MLWPCLTVSEAELETPLRLPSISVPAFAHMQHISAASLRMAKTGLAAWELCPSALPRTSPWRPQQR